MPRIRRWNRVWITHGIAGPPYSKAGGEDEVLRLFDIWMTHSEGKTLVDTPELKIGVDSHSIMLICWKVS